MVTRKFKIVLTEEAADFVMKQQQKARQKILYNILKVECGVMDKEIFKKLENTKI